ncbi:lytic transglycosylase domain-containing protein [Rhodobacteraceae bacterium RKSG542]|uniref:lytic transglycosylase domain-containing protein n=1 Tax=Pseudovibrio flavus TaxID=2529854 RepID=UPI0012BD1F65|nr:lytic transglycosylase domain-containing protein [Pseudovibrio flavus]MTI17409.1 lytic transglycosylase domain-containing protein [Pseudovibrio flavus]
MRISQAFLAGASLFSIVIAVSTSPVTAAYSASTPQPKPFSASSNPVDVVSSVVSHAPRAKPFSGGTVASAPQSASPQPAKPLAYANAGDPLAGQSKLQNHVAAVAQYTVMGDSIPSSNAPVSQLKEALTLMKKGQISEAIAMRNAMPANLDRRIMDWQLMVRGGPEVPTHLITGFAASAPHWPSPKIARARAEATLAKANLTPHQIIGAFGSSPPESLEGKIALATAYVKTGNNSKARALAAPIWHTELLEGRENSFLSTFSKVLSQEDHRLRTEMFLYRDRSRSAERLLPRLSRNHQAYVKARIAQIRGAKNADKLLASVPRSMRNEPGLIFAKVKQARKASDYKTAAALLEKAPRDAKALVNPDEWWVQRRVVSRMLIELGDPKRAYKIAAGHAAESPAEYTEAEWHAGFYALRFLNDPRRAEPHFRNILKIAQTPITLSKAHYWIGRSKEVAGDANGALGAYRNAAQYSTAYYGQLALTKLGYTSLPLQPLPKVTSATRQAFNSNDMVRAIRRLDEAGMHSDTLLLYRQLAEKFSTNAELRLLTQMAEEKDLYQWSLMAGKVAQKGRLDASTLAYPTAAIPAKTKITKGVEKPMVYAIARQESAFNPVAKSHAGALGLLQLMPATARATARNIGVPYSTRKLTADPAYNATLGAAHLGELVEEFNGSYILTFAAYNAGKNKVYEWIERFGDPRSGKIDPVDWIEMIPYGETRSYVQRITENLQVYRHKIDGKPLAIARDITR